MSPVLKFSPDGLYILLAGLGVFSLVFSSTSRFFKERLSISEPVMAIAVGAVLERAANGGRLGPSVLQGGLLQYALQELVRVIIGIQVFTTALELPPGFLNVHAIPIAMFIGPAMLLTWAITFALTYGLLGESLGILPSLATAACLTPTDPVIVHSIAKGAFAEFILPSRVRYLLSAESGINDGAAAPFVMLPLTLMASESGAWKGARFAGGVVAWETIAACLFGSLLGWLSGRVLSWSLKRALIEHDSLLAFTYVLSIATLGIAQLLAMNGPLACFFSGLCFSAGLRARERMEELQLQETADLLAGNLLYLAIGGTFPWTLWFDSSHGLDWWRLVVLAVLLIILKRLPIILVCYRLLPMNIRTLSEAVHIGWFGPVGSAAVLYSLELLAKIRDQQTAQRCYLTVTWIVCVSALVHSCTGVPMTCWLAKGMERNSADPEEAEAQFEEWDLEDWDAKPSASGSAKGTPQAPPPPGVLTHPHVALETGLGSVGQLQFKRGPVQRVLGWVRKVCREMVFHKGETSWVTKRERRLSVKKARGSPQSSAQ